MTEEQLQAVAQIANNINRCETILLQLNDCTHVTITGYGRENVGGQALGMAKWKQCKPLKETYLPLPLEAVRKHIRSELARLKEEAERL